MVPILRLAFAAALSGVAPGVAAYAEDYRGVEAGDVRLEEIPPQPLEEGSCGLFLWARGDEPVLVLATFQDTNQAYIRADGDLRSLRRTRFAGERVHGHFERQIFSDGRLTLDVDLHFDTERALRDGAVVERGVIRVTSGREGWQAVVPVGGVVACKA